MKLSNFNKFGILILIVVFSLGIVFNVQAQVEGEDYFKYSGTGDDYIEIEKPTEFGYLRVEGNAEERHFAVVGYDANNQRTRTFVNTTDYYIGTRLLDFDPQHDTTHLEIDATGDWIIEVHNYKYPDHLLYKGETIEGAGDSVVLDMEGGSSVYITGNQQGRHFAVEAWYDDLASSLLVNTTDYYEGRSRLPSNEAQFIEITAVGDWTIELE